MLPKAYVPFSEKYYFESYYPAGCGIIAGAQALAAVAPNIKIGDVDIDWDEVGVFTSDNITVTKQV